MKYRLLQGKSAVYMSRSNLVIKCAVTKPSDGNMKKKKKKNDVHILHQQVNSGYMLTMFGGHACL